MKKRSALVVLIMAIALLALGLTGCDEDAGDAVDAAASDIGLGTAEMFSDRDLEVGYADYITVNLSDDGCAADSDAVAIDGGGVTIGAEGTYLIQGSLSDGQIIVDAADDAKLQIVLAGTNISCADSAPIYIKNADKVFLTLAAASENQLIVSGDYVQTDDNTVDAAIFAKTDLTINGNGKLTINAAYGHGIVSKDDLVVTGGSLDITAAGHGLAGKDSVRIADGALTINSGKDGIHAENNDDTSLGFIYIADGNFTIAAQSDGIDAKNILQIDNGSFDITTGTGSAGVSAARQENPGAWGGWANWGEIPQGNPSGDADWQRQRPDGVAPVAPDAGNDAAQQHIPVPDSGQAATDDASDVSLKGLKASADLVIKSGAFRVDATDDALHSNANVYVLGGEFALATGDDGVHADATVDVRDGSMIISACYEGIEGSSIDISGGSFDIIADDDGFNAAGGADSSGTGGPGQDMFAADENSYINISGGEIRIDADGDGIDSNGSLSISGGYLLVFGPDGGPDSGIDFSGEASISGGTVISLGNREMTLNFGDSSKQCAILSNLDAAQAAESEIILSEANGRELVRLVAPKGYQSVLISMPELQNDATYTLVSGDLSQTIEMAGTIFSNGRAGVEPGQMGGMGGERPQRMPGQSADENAATE